MQNIATKIQNRARSAAKKIYQSVLLSKSTKKKILFILGCQRSGTTMMTRIFKKDFHIAVYGEFSKLSSQDPLGLRLNPLPEVKNELLKNNAPTVVLKPLVESQNIIKLLTFFERSKAIWMYRDYHDVVTSDLKKFGHRNGIDNIRPLFEQCKDNWRSEGASKETVSKIQRYFSEDMSPYDAAALYWYSRNIHFFECGLDADCRVKLINYEKLVKSPDKGVRDIYNFIDAKLPGGTQNSYITANLIDKGKDLPLSSEIADLCESLLQRLDASASMALKHRQPSLQ